MEDTSRYVSYLEAHFQVFDSITMWIFPCAVGSVHFVYFAELYRLSAVGFGLCVLCRYEVVCPNSVLGCRHSCPREDVADHLQARTLEPFSRISTVRQVLMKTWNLFWEDQYACHNRPLCVLS